MKIAGIHHARFASPDLDATERFATDFGLETVTRTADRLVMKTQGPDAFSYIADRADAAAFVGVGLMVDSVADLDAAVAMLGATPRRPLDTPGGGEEVTLTDPDGVTVSLVHGIAGSEVVMAPRPDLTVNSPAARTRQGDSQHERPCGPPTLYRLGHIGLFVRDFAATSAWYERTLGMIGSDVYHVPHDPAHRIVGFFRIDHGDAWVDHHMIALMQRDTPDCHHISFEVQDFETQFMAHRFLGEQGYEPVWGVGRHPHGSHVFDVWRDPNGYRFETFSDTDVLTASQGTRVHDIKDVRMDLWSSDPPDRYFN